MPGFLMHVNAVMTCFHQAGQATIPPTQPRVLVNGQPVDVATTITVDFSSLE